MQLSGAKMVYPIALEEMVSQAITCSHHNVALAYPFDTERYANGEASYA
ncbi:hypothetical protein [Nostoc sp. PA-18-2419]|nr:hypothetical protein [Nostoc sp. PA-18-2419]